MEENYLAACEYIKNRSKFRPEVAVILGSGLGDFAERFNNADHVSYKDIPYFPTSTVEGHAGKFVISENVMCMQGRVHYYEGYKMEDVTFAIRVMHIFGIKKIIITNAAGGVNKSFNPGDLMIITDHINMMGTNPLIGKNIDIFGPRFPDMSEAYNKDLIKTAEKCAAKNNIETKKGVYMSMTGPSFETPAEIRMASVLGADAVGMSTVPEVIVANHCSMKVLGISCITNMAAGVSQKPLCHEEVIETGNAVKSKFAVLLQSILDSII